MERSELLAYVWTFWCLADRASGRSLIETKIKKSRRAPDPDDALTRAIENTFLEKDHGRRVEKIKDLILKQRDAVSPETGLAVERLLTDGTFPEQIPTDDPRAACGFVAENCALWIRPNSEDFVKLLDDVATNPPTLFYEDKTFASKLQRFSETERCREWRDGELNPLRVLSRDEKRVLSLISPSFDARFRGFVVVGNDPELDRGVIWMGVRDPIQVENLSYRERAWRLRRPLGFVTAFRTSDSVPWFELPDSLVIAPPLVRDVMRSLGVNAGTEPVGIESDDVMRFVDDGTQIVAVSALGHEAAERAVFQRSRTITSSLLWLLDRESLGRAIAAEPSLWSRYIAPSSGFVVVRDTEDARHGLIGDNPLLFADTKSALISLITQAEHCVERSVQWLIENEAISDEGILADFEREYAELLLAMDPTRRDAGDWLVDDDPPLEVSATEMASYLASHHPSCQETPSVHTYSEQHFPDLRENLWVHVARPRLARLLPIDPSLRLFDFGNIRDAGLNVRVFGRTGGGKSAAILGLLTDQFADALKVIVSPLVEGPIRASTAQELTTMIRACSNHQLVVVIDRLEQQLGVPPQDTLLYQVLLLKDRIVREGHVPFTLLVSHWPRDAVFAETYSPILRRWSFIDWALDEPRPEYLRGVAEHVINSLQLPHDTSAVIVEEAIANNATPRALAERLSQQSDSWTEHSDAHFWEEALNDILDGQQEPDVLLALKAVSLLREYNLELRRSMLHAFLCEWLGRSVPSFDRALEFLVERGWVTRRGGDELAADAAQLEAVMTHAPGLRRELQDAVLAGVVPVDESRRCAVLWDGTHDSGSERTLRFLAALATLDPEEARRCAWEAAKAGLRAIEHETLGPLIFQYGQARRADAHEHAIKGQLAELLRVLPSLSLDLGEDTVLVGKFLGTGNEDARTDEMLQYVRSGRASLYELELLDGILRARMPDTLSPKPDLFSAVANELVRARAELLSESEPSIEDYLDS